MGQRVLTRQRAFIQKERITEMDPSDERHQANSRGIHSAVYLPHKGVNNNRSSADATNKNYKSVNGDTPNTPTTTHDAKKA